MSMFCFQCQEAAKGVGCTLKGVCGKTEDVANIQDLLLFVTKGVSIFANEARKFGVENVNANKFVLDALFTTITNANFDYAKIVERVKEGLAIREAVKAELVNAGGNAAQFTHEGAVWTPANDQELEAKADKVGILNEANEDIRSLKELVIYGVKGAAAYAEHAWNLGYEQPSIHAFLQKALAEVCRTDISVDELVLL